jgi:dynein heavy chain
MSKIKWIYNYVQQLWDYVHIVQTNVEDWKTTPWRKVDVENMDIECKKFAKEIRGNPYFI